MKSLLVLLVLLAVPVHAQEGVRKYWVTSVDTMWVGHQKHTHVAVKGKVAYCLKEDDGDKHIKLLSLADSTKYIIAEIIPPYIITCPRKGQVIVAYGISRMDPEHGWREIHPLERWELAQ